MCLSLVFIFEPIFSPPPYINQRDLERQVLTQGIPVGLNFKEKFSFSILQPLMLGILFCASFSLRETSGHATQSHCLYFKKWKHTVDISATR